VKETDLAPKSCWVQRGQDQKDVIQRQTGGGDRISNLPPLRGIGIMPGPAATGGRYDIEPPLYICCRRLRGKSRCGS
jgi:hypothetical protein